MTNDLPRDNRRPSEVVAELFDQVDQRPRIHLMCGHRLTAYRSKNTGRPVLGFGLPIIYPSQGEIDLLLRVLGWEGARIQKKPVLEDGCYWVYIEPPATAS